MPRDDQIEALARSVVNCGFEIHHELGPGLLENAYEVLLLESLRQDGIEAKRQVSLPMKFRGVLVENAYKIDLLVEDKLIIEIKSLERLAPVHSKQLLTYLRLSQLPLGLLMNFGQALFKDGVKRVANNYFADKA
ncbi:MAG: GxxExxY protein [Erythrobacter sp.]|nr:GxxExxY protein [Erythrobacter sp.]